MRTGTTPGAPAAARGVSTNPWLLAILVAVATFMEVLDTTVANVALPYIAGGMGVSEDEASWVVTTYLVSNAIILTASLFLARMLSRKTFFLTCADCMVPGLYKAEFRSPEAFHLRAAEAPKR
jgi:DHA2 family multidrug resistance protein